MTIINAPDTTPRIALLPQHEHLLRETFTIEEFYPDRDGAHAKRKDSELYLHTRHDLIVVKKTPCWISGATTHLETHHYHCEWALADAVDWDVMRALHPAFDWSSWRNPEDFIDSEYNMMVLQDVYHRHKNHGIHCMPYPNWIAQKFVRRDFILTPAQETSTCLA